ncbi:unnamed protein product [Litomosoides sigmodontis]|uniref:Uncharacterized protein n=1 Tax=Litomosoides sigmodontis TaxID=42156 RepID=A0A3P6U5T7_LITSI|nr:unnamed protein product [Litomosoides sigmodontis]
MSAPPPYQSPQCQYPSPQNYGAPGYCYPAQPQQPYYPNQPAFGHGYSQQPPFIQTAGPPQSSGSNSSKCCLWALLAFCFGCCLGECCVD